MTRFRRFLKLQPLEERTVPSTFTVTNTDDAASGSLRQAIVAANSSPGADIIAFDPSYFNVARTITLTTGAISIIEELNIQGPGASLLAVSGNKNGGILQLAIPAVNQKATISGINFTQASMPALAVTGTVVSGKATILTNPQLVVSNVSFVGNSAAAIAVPDAGIRLTILNSTISANSVAAGGTINVTSPTSLIIENSTISGNTAQNGGALSLYGTVPTNGAIIRNATLSGNSATSDGGGIVLGTFVGTLIVQSSTIAQNTCSGKFGGGGIARVSGSGAIQLDSSIVSNNVQVGGNYSDLFSGGVIKANVSAVGTAKFVGGFQPDATTSQLLGANFQLAPLADNGGPTQTHALLAGSPCINLGGNTTANTDQRGFQRVVNTRADIGAFEFGATQVTPVPAGGTVVGYVYFDANTNGKFDVPDHGQSGVIVYLDANGNGARDFGEVSTVSGQDGRYSLTATVDGYYVLRQVAPTGATQVDSTAQILSLTLGYAVNEVNFGNYRQPPLFAAGADRGQQPFVVVYNADGSPKFGFYAFDTNFLGGVRVATADINGDGVGDIITAAGPGGGPHVKITSGANQKVLAEFYAYDANMSAGVFVSAGDVDGDGRMDVITGAGNGAESRVRAFSGTNLNGPPIRDFVAYPTDTPGVSYTVGVTVAAGDFNGDGRADIVTGPEAGNPHVKVFDGTSPAVNLIHQFFAYSPIYPVGASVAVGDYNGDSRPDIITGAIGPGGGPHVRAFSGADGSVIREFFAYRADFFGGIRMAVSDLDFDGRVEIISAPGPTKFDPPGATANVRVFDQFGNPNKELTPFAGFLGGAYVG